MNQEMSILFQLYDSISSSLHTHWNFFAVVGIGVITGMSFNKNKIGMLLGVLLILGFGLFQGSNYHRIYETIQEISIVEDQIKFMLNGCADCKVGQKFISFYSGDSIRVNQYWHLFHFAIGLIVVVVIAAKTEWCKKVTTDPKGMCDSPPPDKHPSGSTPRDSG